MKYILATIILLSLASCFTFDSSTRVKSSEVMDYLNKSYDDTFELVSFGEDRNAGNLFDKNVGYAARVHSKFLNEQLTYYCYRAERGDSMRLSFDYYPSDRMCIYVGKKLTKPTEEFKYKAKVGFTTWLKNEQFDNYAFDDERMEELQKKMFEQSSISVRLMFIAPDYLENRRKYLDFYFNFMEELKKQHVEKATVHLAFFDNEVNLEGDPKVYWEIDVYDDRFDLIEEHLLEQWIAPYSVDLLEEAKESPKDYVKRFRVIERDPLDNPVDLTNEYN